MYTESVDLFEGVATEPEETKRSCKRGRSDNACIQAWLQINVLRKTTHFNVALRRFL